MVTPIALVAVCVGDVVAALWVGWVCVVHGVWWTVPLAAFVFTVHLAWIRRISSLPTAALGSQVRFEFYRVAVIGLVGFGPLGLSAVRWLAEAPAWLLVPALPLLGLALLHLPATNRQARDDPSPPFELIAALSGRKTTMYTASVLVYGGLLPLVLAVRLNQQRFAVVVALAVTAFLLAMSHAASQFRRGARALHEFAARKLLQAKDRACLEAAVDEWSERVMATRIGRPDASFALALTAVTPLGDEEPIDDTLRAMRRHAHRPGARRTLLVVRWHRLARSRFPVDQRLLAPEAVNSNYEQGVELLLSAKLPMHAQWETTQRARRLFVSGDEDGALDLLLRIVGNPDASPYARRQAHFDLAIVAGLEEDQDSLAAHRLAAVQTSIRWRDRWALVREARVVRSGIDLTWFLTHRVMMRYFREQESFFDDPDFSPQGVVIGWELAFTMNVHEIARVVNGDEPR